LRKEERSREPDGDEGQRGEEDRGEPRRDGGGSAVEPDRGRDRRVEERRLLEDALTGEARLKVVAGAGHSPGDSGLAGLVAHAGGPADDPQRSGREDDRKDAERVPARMESAVKFSQCPGDGWRDLTRSGRRIELAEHPDGPDDAASEVLGAGAALEAPSVGELPDGGLRLVAPGVEPQEPLGESAGIPDLPQDGGAERVGGPPRPDCVG